MGKCFFVLRLIEILINFYRKFLKEKGESLKKYISVIVNEVKVIPVCNNDIPENNYPPKEIPRIFLKER